MRAVSLAVLLAACGDASMPPPDAGCDPADRACVPMLTCNELRATTVVAPDVIEVGLAGTPIVADDQNQYVCAYDMPNASDITWTVNARYQTGPTAGAAVGAIVITDGVGLYCKFQSAIETRATFKGACDAD